MAEQEMPNPDQMNELLFMQVVMMFQGMAMQNLGKVMNPVTQKVERNLDQAKSAIDILGMLEAKTKGNLSDNENQLLEHTLFELRMNYVEEVNKPSEAASETGETASEIDSEENQTEDAEAAGDAEKEPGESS